MIAFLRELWARLRSSTPPFFKKLMVVFASLGLTAGGLLATAEYLPDWLPVWVLKSAVAVSAGAVFVCKSVVDWNKTSPDDVPAVTPPAAVQIIKDAYDLPDDDASHLPTAS